jgi:hypothetical protein
VTRFRTTGGLLIALITAGLCSAQPPKSRGDWGNLKTLTSGAQIQITMTDRPKAIRGRFQSVTDDNLVVTTAAGQEMLGRPLVAKVSVQKNNHRIRNSLLGLAIGAGGGLAAGAAIDAADQCSGGLGKCGLQIVGPNAGKEVLTPVGAFIGLAIGALLHTGGWREVY